MTEDPPCPGCGEEMSREEVDIGVGIIYGPYGCWCGYSEYPKQPDRPGWWTDQWGVSHNINRVVESCARFGLGDAAAEAFEVSHD